MALKQGFAVKGDPKESGRKGGLAAQKKYEEGESSPHRFLPGEDSTRKAGQVGAEVRWAKHREKMIAQMQEEIAKRRQLQYAPPAENPKVRAEYDQAKRELKRLKSAERRALARGAEARTVVENDLRAMAQDIGEIRMSKQMEAMLRSISADVEKEEKRLQSEQESLPFTGATPMPKSAAAPKASSKKSATPKAAAAPKTSKKVKKVTMED